MIPRHILALAILHLSFVPVAMSEVVFQADFQAATAVTGSVTANASPTVLNAGTSVGSWVLSGTGGGNSGAIIANSSLTQKSFVFDSLISGDVNDLASGLFSRSVNLAAGDDLTFDFKLYASRQGTGRQVRLAFQNSSGANAYTLTFALDNAKIFGWNDPSGTTTTLSTAISSNTGFTNPLVNSYLSWSPGTMIQARVEIVGQTTVAGSSGAKLSVDWNGDGDFTDAGEISQSLFGPSMVGVSALDRFQLQYGGTSGNRGVYLDDFMVSSTPAIPILNYAWTGTSSGGDGVSLYQEANWSLNGDNTNLISLINSATPVNQNLTVNSGTPGGGGATGNLDLGLGSLTVNGGTFRMNNSSGIIGGGISHNLGTTESMFIDSSTVTLTGGTIRLTDAGDPLRTGTVINFTAASTGILNFTSESPSNTISEHLAQITVNGLPAQIGVNLSIITDGAGGSQVTVFSGDPDSDDDGMNDAWEYLYFNTLNRDGSDDFDLDGLSDLNEFVSSTLPNNRDTDGDTLADGAENKSGTWVSLNSTGTDPLKIDTDGDGLPDHLEVNNNTNPNLTASTVTRPNVIFVLCDDLGYGDLGAFFQNQRAAAADPANPWFITPRIDTIAGEGIQLRGHYCPAPVCAPSRASLLLGVHQGHANVRDNQFDKALEDNHTLATMMKSAGYGTYCVGKWGLQGGSGFPAHPLKRGFDSYFGYISHGAGHAHYPKEDAKALYDGFIDVRSQFDKCYTTDLFAARAKKVIADHRAATPAKPFFLYLAYDTPHAELQLPTTAYPAGAGLTGGLQWNGTPGSMINTASGTVDSWFHPDYANATWDDPAVAGSANPWPDVYKRYATMVRRIDDTMHDLVQTLKDLGIDNDTLVIFSSDNGPSKESYLSGTDANGYSREYAPTFFESYGNFDGIKRDLWEGGIRVGAIARWPGTIPPAQISNTPSQFHDWMPTLAEIAKTQVPARTDGVSLMPTLTASGIQRTPSTYVEYTEGGATPNYTDFLSSRRNRDRDQMQMIRIGDMVGVRYGITSHTNNFEIYNVMTDPGQTTNLASSNTALQQQMKNRVLQLRRPDSSAVRPYDGEMVPPPISPSSLVSGLRFRGYNLLSTSVPDDATLVASKNADSPLPNLALLTRPTHCQGVFDGWLQVPTEGIWSFQLTTDSHAHVRLNSATLLDADGPYTPGSLLTTSIPLKAGLHSIRITYSRTTGTTPLLDFKWSGPSVSLQAVPATAYFSGDGDDDEDGWIKSQEAAAGTSDYLADSDSDGLLDPTDFDPDVPNTAPAAISLSNSSIPENLPSAVVGNLSAMQNDAGDQLTWSLVAGSGATDNAAFSLIGNQFSLVASADFESKPSYSIRVRATDLGGLFTEMTFVIQVINDAIGLTFAEWHQNQFGAAPIDWAADDDRDGLGRLMEYALGGDPAMDSSAFLPKVLKAGNTIAFSYVRRVAGTHDLDYQVQISGGLSDWLPFGGAEVSVTSGPLQGYETVVLEPIITIQSSRFLRLKVQQNP